MPQPSTPCRGARSSAPAGHRRGVRCSSSGCGRLPRPLQGLSHRRGATRLAGRVCPSTQRATRVANPRADPPAVRGHAHSHPRVRQPERLRPGRHARAARLAVFEATSADITDLGEGHGHRVLKVHGKRRSDRARATATGGRTRPRPGRGRAHRGSAATQPAGGADGPPRRHPSAPTSRRHRGCADRPDAPHTLRHTFVTTMLDAGVDLRDVQIAARHADPRTTMRLDRARNNLDRHPDCILAAWHPAPNGRPRSFRRAVGLMRVRSRRGHAVRIAGVPNSLGGSRAGTGAPSRRPRGCAGCGVPRRAPRR